MFKPTGKTSIEIIKSQLPVVSITSVALNKMKAYIELNDKEVGWLGTAFKTGINTYCIEDVFLLEQEANSVTTEINPDALEHFIQEHIDDMRLINNLKIWGHSHVNMSTSPSGQDDKQMEDFIQSQYDFFIRIIGNKKNELRVDLYNYETGIVYQQLSFDEQIPIEINALYEQLIEINNTINEIQENNYNRLIPIIKEEIKEKVKTITSKYYTGKSGTVTNMNDYDYLSSEYDYFYGGLKKKDNNKEFFFLEDEDFYEIIDESTLLGVFSFEELYALSTAQTIDDTEDILNKILSQTTVWKNEKVSKEEATKIYDTIEDCRNELNYILFNQYGDI